MGGGRAGDCGASPWCGRLRQTSIYQACCRSHFSQNHVRIAKRHFAPWQAAKSSGASFLQALVWRGFGRLLWPDSPLRCCHYRQSNRASAFSTRKTKCRSYLRLNMFFTYESRTIGRRCQRLEISSNKWQRAQVPLVRTSGEPHLSNDYADSCSSEIVRPHVSLSAIRNASDSRCRHRSCLTRFQISVTPGLVAPATSETRARYGVWLRGKLELCGKTVPGPGGQRQSAS